MLNVMQNSTAIPMGREHFTSMIPQDRLTPQMIGRLVTVQQEPPPVEEFHIRMPELARTPCVVTYMTRQAIVETHFARQSRTRLSVERLSVGVGQGIRSSLGAIQRMPIPIPGNSVMGPLLLPKTRHTHIVQKGITQYA